MSSADIARIERGNTSPGVNREIIAYLAARGDDFAGAAFLDLPCGAGAFLDAVRRFFPGAETVGGDLRPPPAAFVHEYCQIDASRDFTLAEDRKFRVVTSISGVMEFDNTLAFFERVGRLVADDGLFIVTNDNLLAARDRVLYLLFGRFRQYRLFIEPGAPTWKILTLQNLRRILADAGFEVVAVRYVPPKPAEWLWLPLALPLYVFQKLYLRFAEKDVPAAVKNELYPFASLLARHYVVVCRPER